MPTITPDLTDQKFGALTVIRQVYSDKPGAHWLTVCECGTERVFSGGHLRRRGKSCGCLDPHAKLNLLGEKFGDLTVIAEAKKLKGRRKRRWRCSCSCGRKVTVWQTNLRSGAATKCGWAHSIRLVPKKRAPYKRKNLLDITDQRFGRLVAKYELPREPGEARKWHCICDCGAERDVWQGNLLTATTRSCGCISREPHNNEYDGTAIALQHL